MLFLSPGRGTCARDCGVSPCVSSPCQNPAGPPPSGPSPQMTSHPKVGAAKLHQGLMFAPDAPGQGLVLPRPSRCILGPRPPDHLPPTCSPASFCSTSVTHLPCPDEFRKCDTCLALSFPPLPLSRGLWEADLVSPSVSKTENFGGYRTTVSPEAFNTGNPASFQGHPEVAT